MKKIYFILLGLFFISVVLFFEIETVYAEDGGVVQTTGDIGFYQGNTPTTTSSSDYVEKPKGSLPSTGELIAKSLLVTGGILFLLFLTSQVLKYVKKERESS